MGRDTGVQAHSRSHPPTVAEEEAAQELADVFSALSNPTRILMLLYLVEREYTNQELLEVMGHPQISLWRNLETLHNVKLLKKRSYSRQEIGYAACVSRLVELTLFLQKLVDAAIQSLEIDVDIEALYSPRHYRLIDALGLPKKE